MKPRRNDGQKFQTSVHLKLKGKKRDKILARWTDGLFYFVKVTKVSTSNNKCMVEFEDQSTASVLFKDLLEEKEDGVTQCHKCGKEDAKPSDKLIQCSNCERDYHQSCHVPPIKENEGTEKFVCRICVFASCAQAGGAKSSGPLAEKFSAMKQYFPYDIKYLTWNAGHTSNVEHSFCYCGGPGIWYNKMLQCCRCRQWFHEACLQTLKEELLIGDRFYIFACAHCNHGVEFLQRMELDWLLIAHITVFHLIMTMGTRYVDLDTDILPLVMDHAQSFGCKRLINGMHGCREIVRDILLTIFRQNSTLFCCGSEVKKRCTYFGVRERNPPNVSPFSIPVTEYVITAESLKDPSIKKTTFQPSKYTFSVPYVLRGAKKVVPPTLSARLKESKLAKIARVKSEHNYCTPVKCQEEIPIKRIRKSPTPTHVISDISDANNNSPAKTSPAKSDEISKEIDVIHDSSDDEEAEVQVNESPCRVLTYPDEEPKDRTLFWSLDTAFPEPVNFAGANHPFLTEFEQDNIRKKRKHFEEELFRLSSVLAKDNSRGGDLKHSVQLVPPPPNMDVKGFRGELAELIHSSGILPVGPSPKKLRTSHAENITHPEKSVYKTGLCHNETSPKKTCINSSSKMSNSSRSSSLSPHRISSQRTLKNGFTQIKQDPSSFKISELLDKAADKRMKALSKCLKNLSPTCGFRFPVLDEMHQTVATNSSFIVNHLTDNQMARSKNCKSSLSQQKSSKSKKQKHLGGNQRDECQSLEKTSSTSETVRRSHRSRQTVKRFEASLGSKSYDDFYQSVHCPSVDRVTADQYEVVSLRIRPDNNMVEYLVDWSQAM